MTRQCAINYTYQQYLDLWDANFGDADFGERIIRQDGIEKRLFLKMMSEKEFVEMLNEFNELNSYDELSFEYELILLADLASQDQ